MSRRKWIDTVEAYKDLPLRIPQERLEQLVYRLRCKDKSVSEEIIRGHLRLGLSIIQKVPNYDLEDLVGEMELAVTTAVWMAGRGALKNNNITSYITSYVKYYINDYIKENRLVTAPSRTIRHWNSKFKEAKLFHRISMVEGEPYKTDDSNQSIRLQSTSAAFHTPTIENDSLDEIDVRDVLEKITYSNSEKRIIELKEEGYNIEEIGQIIGYSKSMVHKLLHNIEDRFDHYIKEAE